MIGRLIINNGSYYYRFCGLMFFGSFFFQDSIESSKEQQLFEI